MVGHGSHASIALIIEISPHQTTSLMNQLVSHRDLITGHLIWVVIFLGVHSFGLYVHNDTLQALGRPEDTFSDSSFQLRPIFSTLVGFITPPDLVSSFQSKAIDQKISSASSSLLKN